ncbi:MORN repeat-containing protein 5-like [Anastrepha obliqua]|uniref:MORN repeat-containing protein 5-like n=1 Tax=Anastrepha obliqua TaxID=95512 RepID=UPI002409796F|nr:MORN repeat-containing protein 5-like [Anastrepha obliqua]
MQRSQKFCTGSNYFGTYNNPLNCMDGYGHYNYPDGSEYRGFFRQGRFHGVGRLRMSAPYSFTFIGQFENGELTVVNEMIYPDGLVFHADFKSGEIDTANWEYLSKSDRRYTRELCMGIPAVVPHEPITRYNPRSLEPNTYDTEEGIFIEKSHFTTKIPPPFHHQRFVNCNKELNWIRNCCRHAETDAIVEPDAAKGHDIIQTNIKAMTQLGENLHTCTCNMAQAVHQVHMKKFCRRLVHTKDDPSSTSQYSRDYKDEQSSISTSSFSDNPVPLNLIAECRNEIDQLALKDNDLTADYYE